MGYYLPRRSDVNIKNLSGVIWHGRFRSTAVCGAAWLLNLWGPMKSLAAFRILRQTDFVSKFLQSFARTNSSGLGTCTTHNFISVLGTKCPQFVLITGVPTEIRKKQPSKYKSRALLLYRYINPSALSN